MKILATLLLSSALVTNAFAAPKIGFAGDSISKGMGDSNPAYSSAGIVGSGVSIGNRDKNEQHWKQFTKGTDLTIVEVGTNDFGYTGSKYKEYLTKYISPLNKNICMVQIPLSLREEVRKGAMRLNPIEAEWAKENHYKVVDFPHWEMSDRLKDGLHFTPSAYKRFAETVVKECEGK